MQPVVQSYILSQLLQQSDFPQSPVLYVVEDEYAKLTLYNLIHAWLHGVRKHVPLFFDTKPATLATVLKNKACMLLLTRDEHANGVPSKRSFQKHTIRLCAGDKIQKSELLKQCIDAGYSLDRTAAAHGLIANRGGVLDIFPPDSTHAYRLEFNDDVIESIAPFKPREKVEGFVNTLTIIPYTLDHLPKSGTLDTYAPDIKTLACEPFPPQADAIVSFSASEISELTAHIQPPTETLSSKQSVSFIKDLNEGDYVVHVDHGVAIFNGIVEQNIEGITREYFKLTYAEEDILFLPVTMAEKMEKYVGDPNPPLQRLSGGSWHKTVAKITLETLSQARELLNTHARRQLVQAYRIPQDETFEKKLAKTFPYEETNDQRAVIEAVYRDLDQPTPMDRLVCGDVGFGKTEVAIRAAAKVAQAGYQVAVLSPTTILSQQHLDNFQERLKDCDLKVAGLSRFESKASQTQTIAGIAEGSVDIVVGTHRLLSKDVHFQNLGLIIIDEEQRFGVQHKEHLKKMRSQAHILTLTATPIPRTLHLGLSGVRAISTISTPPEGRRPIETHIEPHNDKRIKEAIEQELERKGQVYYLHNNVETMPVKCKQLDELLVNARIGMLHGQLPEQEIARVMHAFDNKELDVLVCSTIIENGLDLPNVNTLIVDNAVQFGLAQLHQIRGRIGRGARQAYAYFFFKRQKLTGEAAQRLEALEQANKLGAGYELAQRDMEIRGIGNVLGKAQHGHVKSVGLNLYLRLLQKSVKEIKTGEVVEIVPDISIDLPLEARIPKHFESNKQKRIERYHEWALIETMDELQQTKNNLLKDGALPQQLENLFYILKIKLLGKQARLQAIDTAFASAQSSDKVIILKPQEPIEPKRYAQMLDICDKWQYSTDELKVKQDDMGDDWMRTLEKSIQSLIT